MPADEPEEVTLSLLFCVPLTNPEAYKAEAGLLRMQSTAITTTTKLQNQTEVSTYGKPCVQNYAHSLHNNHRTLLHRLCACVRMLRFPSTLNPQKQMWLCPHTNEAKPIN